MPKFLSVYVKHCTRQHALQMTTYRLCIRADDLEVEGQFKPVGLLLWRALALQGGNKHLWRTCCGA